MRVLQLTLAFYVVASFLRVWFVRRLTGMPYTVWFRAVILRIVFATLPGFAAAAIVCLVLGDGLLRLLCLMLVVGPAVALGTFVFAMDRGERRRWLMLIKQLRCQIVRRGEAAVSPDGVGRHHPA